MDILMNLMAGIDIPIPECQLVLHQPQIHEISYIGQQDFYSGLYTLILDKNLIVEDKRDLANTSNFQIFMTVISQKEAAPKKQAVIQVLKLILPNYTVNFTPQSIILLKSDNPPVMIDSTNFEVLQEALKQMFCLRSQNTASMGAYNPGSKRAKEIAAKLARGRQKAAAEKGESETNLFVLQISVLTVGLSSMSLNDLLSLTVFQLNDLFERYSLYTNWDIDIRSRLAGAKSESKIENWMKNIH